MTYTEKLVSGLKMGEGPHWDVSTQSLYFVDITDNSIHRYSPSTKQHTKAHITGNNGESVSLIIPVKNEIRKFVVTIGRSVQIIEWDGKNSSAQIVRKIGEVNESTENRFNDGKCDAKGRLWAGTMKSDFSDGSIQGNLYNFDLNNVSDGLIQPSVHVQNVGISNGLAWSLDNKILYYIDSFAKNIKKFDFNLELGSICNESVLFSLVENEIPGLPDGMTIDSEGNLWVAIYDGNRVIQISSQRTNALLQTVMLPATQITSVAFGGETLENLYVTSAINGSLFEVRNVGAKGVLAQEFQCNL